MTTFYHLSDPNAPKNPYHVWHFVYLDGEAEVVNGQMAHLNGWEWQAPDLFLADQPMPTVEGEYEATLYGQRVVVFIHKRFGSYLGGRAVFWADTEAYEYASHPERWC